MTFSAHTLGAALLLALQFGVAGQRGDSISGLIVGQVVDGESGRPVGGALVAMSGPGMPSGSLPRILTGGDGRFVFRGLRRGNFNILVQKPGYAEGAHGRTRPAGPALPLTLADGQRTGDVVVRLWKHASISGTVVDESGERLIGVRVQAYRRAVISGRRRYMPSGTALTDDRGIYRVGGLIPGEYIVGAVARQIAVPISMARELAGRGAAGMSTGNISAGGGSSTQPMITVGNAGLVLGGGAPTPPPPSQGRVALYPPTFHPSAPAGDAATLIPLGPGAEYLTADLHLSPVPTVSVSGRVVGPEGVVSRTVLRLVAAHTAEIGLEADAIGTTTDGGGEFTFPAVPSGLYTLRLLRGFAPQARATADVNNVLWTDLPVSVGIEDIQELSVEAQPGVRVGGRIEFEGRTPRPAALNSIAVTIEPADPTPGGGVVTGARVDSYGEFRSAPLPGGRYYVRIPNSPGGWMFKSATTDGRDVADTPLTLAADALNLVITFTDRWSGVRGSVQTGQSPDEGAAVIVFPTDTDAWASSGMNPRRVRMVRPGRNGEYSLNLPPGEYFVIAVPDAQAADWQDPVFLDAASRAGTRIVIAEGERKVQHVRTRVIR